MQVLEQPLHDPAAGARHPAKCCSEPAHEMDDHQLTHWCLYTGAFGVAMKTEYVTPDGTKFFLEAYKYPFQDAVATCRIEGVAAGRYSCDARAGNSDWLGKAAFILADRSHDRG
jgi:hypothetical protein